MLALPLSQQMSLVRIPTSPGRKTADLWNIKGRTTTTLQTFRLLSQQQVVVRRKRGEGTICHRLCPLWSPPPTWQQQSWQNYEHQQETIVATAGQGAGEALIIKRTVKKTYRFFPSFNNSNLNVSVFILWIKIRNQTARISRITGLKTLQAFFAITGILLREFPTTFGFKKLFPSLSLI